MLHKYKQPRRQPRNIIDALYARSILGNSVSDKILEIEGVFADVHNVLTPITIKTDIELAQEQKELRRRIRQERNHRRQEENAAAAQENPAQTYRRRLF